eukprot:Gb_08942 [translate_table: standard]
MNSVKARENYEAALSLLPELKEEQSVPQLFKVVRHVFSMNSLLRLMGDKDSVSIWKQTIKSPPHCFVLLHELVKVALRRSRSPNEALQWCWMEAQVARRSWQGYYGDELNMIRRLQGAKETSFDLSHSLVMSFNSRIFLNSARWSGGSPMPS